jgi:hypothetical protein
MNSHATTFANITAKRRMRVIEKLLEMSIAAGGFHCSNVWFLRSLLLVNNPNVWGRGVQCLLSGFDNNPGAGVTRFNSAEETVIDRKCFSLVVLLPKCGLPASWVPNKTNGCYEIVRNIIAGAPICVLRTRKTQSFPTLCHPISGMPMTRIVLYGTTLYDTLGFPLPQLSYNGAGEVKVSHDGQTYSVPAMTLSVSAEHVELYEKSLGTMGSYGFWARDLVFPLAEDSSEHASPIHRDLCESWGLPAPTVNCISNTLGPVILDTNVIADYFLEGGKKQKTRLVISIDFRETHNVNGYSLGKMKDPHKVMVYESFGPLQ